MSTERDYQELYDRLLEEVGALHRANQRRIRSGMWALLAVTVGLMILMFLAGGNKVFTLMLWILSMFAVAAYLIAVEYMDYGLQKKLRDIARLEESAFDGLMNVPASAGGARVPGGVRSCGGIRSRAGAHCPGGAVRPCAGACRTGGLRRAAARPAGACRAPRCSAASGLGACAGGSRQAGGRPDTADPCAAEPVRGSAPRR